MPSLYLTHTLSFEPVFRMFIINKDNCGLVVVIYFLYVNILNSRFLVLFALPLIFISISRLINLCE